MIVNSEVEMMGRGAITFDLFIIVFSGADGAFEGGGVIGGLESWEGGGEAARGLRHLYILLL